MKRLLSFILTLTAILSLFSCSTYAQNPDAPTDAGPSGPPVSGADASVLNPEGSVSRNEFREDLFFDVNKDDWFFDHVKTAYELGIMAGQGEGSFAPLAAVSLAEAVTMAATLRSSHTGDHYDFSGGEPWYAPMADYAIAQGVIRAGEFSDYTAAATRAQFAYILSGALPSGTLDEINTVEDNSLPDVRMGDEYAANIYLLYRAGVLSGSDERGTFSPSGTITRAEAAAITSRLASAPLRTKCEFHAPVYPDLSLRARADDSFFEKTAILGNSLIDGLRLYAKLSTADFYCGTSMSVNSALNSQNVPLNNGSYGTQLDAMAQKQYDKVYIELGINEIGGSVEPFINLYGAMLDKIKAAQPNADIYIMAITPTSRGKNGTSFSKERVVMYNDALYKLAGGRECYYLDVFTPLADGEGYLPDSDTWDGVHFTVAKYADWEELIRTYYA